MFEASIAWLLENRKWLFSGVGIAIIAWIGHFFYKQLQATTSQKIRSGKKSTNLQAGRDLNLEIKTKGNNVEEKK